MRTSMHTILSQGSYAKYLQETAAQVADIKKGLAADELAKWDRFKNNPESFAKGAEEFAARQMLAKSLMKGMIKQRLAKAGVATSTGYNFYDLRAPVQLSFPVNVPLRNELPRIGRVNDGYGVAAHWKATRDVGVTFVGVPEGERAQTATPDENDYTATYKEIGVERAVTFTAQYAGEGYADNLADEHLRGLYELWLGEEGMMWLGNSGNTGSSGVNATGFRFSATTPIPDIETIATPSGVTSTLYGGSPAVGKYCSVSVVYLTGMGNPNNGQYGYGTNPSVAKGLTTTSGYNAPGDGTPVSFNCGTSKISAMSGVVQVTSDKRSIYASVDAANLPVKGCFGYAWFLNVTDQTAPSLANAYLVAITTQPFATLSTAPTPSTPYAGNSAGLDGDKSYNSSLEFDGLLSYAAGTPGATWVDMLGTSFTSGKNGKVNEVEAVLQAIWTAYQSGISQIWGSFDAVVALDQAIRYGGTNPSAYRFEYTRDQQGNLLGGFVVSSYLSRFSMNPNGYAIPIRPHPMLPPGTLYFDLATVPYPHARAPFSRGMLVQRDYYSIEWPLVNRRWTFGTYAHEVLAHNYPWIPAVLTGIGPFNNSQ